MKHLNQFITEYINIQTMEGNISLHFYILLFLSIFKNLLSDNVQPAAPE